MNTNSIVIVGGLPRTGKTLLRNTLGSHSEIAFSPTGLNFFNIFSEENYNSRGEFEDNLNYFINDNWIAEKWGIKNIAHKVSGNSRKELLPAILNIYRKEHWPNKKYTGTYIHNSEEKFDTLMKWFGKSNLKFLHIIRDPFDNYSSLVKSRNIDRGLRSKSRYNSFVNKFCNMWSQSAVIGLTNSLRYPDSYKTILFDELKGSLNNNLELICEWLQISFQKNNMSNMIDFDEKINTAFKKSEGNKIIDRKKYLTKYEINEINNMACTNLLNATGYKKSDIVLDYKLKKNISIKNYSKMIFSINKTLLSPFSFKQSIYINLIQLFRFQEIKNLILIISLKIKDKFIK